MLRGKKKLLRNITEWVDGQTNETSSWVFSDEIVRIPGTNAAFNLWSKWRLGGQWPLGNWLRQPLSLLMTIEAIDTVYWTWKELRHNSESDERPRGLAAMDGTQLEIVRVFDNA